MFAVKNWRRFVALTAFVCAVALAGCGKKDDPPKAEGGTPTPADPKEKKKNGDITPDDLRDAVKSAGGDPDKLKGGKNEPPVQSPVDAQLQDAAAKKVDTLKGIAYRDERAPGKPVVRILLGDTKVTDDDLAEFAKLQTITILWINNTSVSDASMKVVASFKVLTELNLTSTKITDTGLKELTALKNLKKLDLSFTKVTDEGVKEFQNALPACKIER